MTPQDLTFIPDQLYAEFVRSMPVCTVDVLLLNPTLTHALLFLRRNQPAKGEWYTLGGRLTKNETARDCAVRQANAEAGITLDPDGLFFGAVVEEMFEDSRFGAAVSCHMVNICWGYVLPEGHTFTLDDQHERCEWKPVDDPSLHCYVKQKIAAVLEQARLRAGVLTSVR